MCSTIRGESGEPGPRTGCRAMTVMRGEHFMSYRFNPPPNWHIEETNWTPPPGWQPDPAWGPAPEGWNFWIEDTGDAPAAAADEDLTHVQGTPPAEEPSAPATGGEQAAPAAGTAASEPVQDEPSVSAESDQASAEPEELHDGTGAGADAP